MLSVFAVRHGLVALTVQYNNGQRGNCVIGVSLIKLSFVYFEQIAKTFFELTLIPFQCLRWV